jgi:hypothetical protein
MLKGKPLRRNSQDSSCSALLPTCADHTLLSIALRCFVRPKVVVAIDLPLSRQTIISVLWDSRTRRARGDFSPLDRYCSFRLCRGSRFFPTLLEGWNRDVETRTPWTVLNYNFFLSSL